MEKRLILAFILSFLVLLLWSTLIPRPTPRVNSTDFVSKNALSSEKAPMMGALSDSVATPEDKSAKISEIIQHEQTAKYDVEFTNLGGSIKSIYLREYKASLPVTEILTMEGHDSVEYHLDRTGDNRDIRYSYQENDIKITKQYHLTDEYNVQSEIEIENLSKMSKLIDLNIKNFRLDINRMDNIRLDINRMDNSQEQALYEYSINLTNNIIRKGNAFKFSIKNDEKHGSGEIQWLGFRDRYYCLIVKPMEAINEYKAKFITAKILDLAVAREKYEIPAGQKMTLNFNIYCGPQILERLKSYHLGFESIMSFSGFGILDGISKIIYNFMHFLYKSIPNWGICIILVSVALHLLMYPLTKKSMVSMKKMQAVQPKLTQLKEKHKSNPQKLNQEMMALYKEHRINPLGGCLPLILQMPIFIGLYQVLWRSVSFKGAGFLWIKDLSMPDRLLLLPYHIPIIGNEINILPFLMMIIMFFQQKMSSKNMVVTDPAQITQQKMMMTIFPVFIGFIFYKFASGLCLYFTVFYLLSTLTQWKMSKQPQVIVSG